MLPVQWRRFNFFEKDLVRQGDLPHPELKGGVHFVHPDFHVTAFQAFERAVTLVHQLPTSPILVTVGDDDEVIDPTVKIWRVDRVEREANPECLRILKIAPGKAQIFPVTTLAVTDDLSVIALGMVNGAVHLFFSDKDNVIYEPNVRQRMLVARDVNPVTGLYFAHGTRQLFISTSAYVKCYDPLHEATEVLDEKGAELNCACMSDEGQLVVGRKEAVYFYDTEGHGPCFAFEADKKMLAWVKGYLAVVGKDGEGDMNTFTIYDLKNKLVAYSGAFQNIMCVLPEWGYVFVLCRDGKLYQLDEADMAAKIETLFKKNLYQVAISLAQTFGVDQATLTDIYKRYGDHLYGKGDFDGSISQYIRTIGSLDASYVIMKFLDAQRIHNLTKFLQALHEKREANPDHTTLLLSCYTKLKDVNQLDKFIAADWEFSAETAISVCRASGYLRQAEEIARKHKEHSWVLKILVEDFNDHQAALEYLTTLEPAQTEQSLKLYGSALAVKRAEQVMALLMNIFRKRDEADGKTRPPPQSAPEEFIHVFVKHTEWCIRFLEFLVSQDYNSKLLYNTLLELYLTEEEENPHASKRSNRMSMAPTPKKKEKLSRAYAMLTDPKSNYQVEHALILCEQARFHAGALYLYEKMKLYNEILQYYMLRGDYENVIVTCRRHGDKEPNLWIRALSYFATADEPCETEIAEILNHIDREALMSPPQVIQVLSKKPGASIALVRDYVVRKCETNRQTTMENQKQVKQYVDETERFRGEIDEFRTTMKTVNANKCSVCQGPLDVPVVHFLCMHSYHQHCLPESLDNEGPECVICAKANQQLFETRASLAASAIAHDKFFKQLAAAPDGFVTVSEFLGRQIFTNLDPILLEKDEPNLSRVEEELQIEARRAHRVDPIRVHEGFGAKAIPSANPGGRR